MCRCGRRGPRCSRCALGQCSAVEVSTLSRLAKNTLRALFKAFLQYICAAPERARRLVNTQSCQLAGTCTVVLAVPFTSYTATNLRESVWNRLLSHQNSKASCCLRGSSRSCGPRTLPPWKTRQTDSSCDSVPTEYCCPKLLLENSLI